MKHIIDMSTWERKESFDFFMDFLNPCINVTFSVNAGHAKALAKKNEESFFLYYLYAVLKAANDIKEFKFRIDKEGRVVYYDKINVLTPIKLPGMKTFATVCIQWHEDFPTFYKQAKEEISKAENNTAFSAEKAITEYDVILLSAIPDLPFTSLTATQCNKTNIFPLITIGKINSDGIMPMSLCVFHGFIDGEHIAAFYKNVSENLNELLNR